VNEVALVPQCLICGTQNTEDISQGHRVACISEEYVKEKCARVCQISDLVLRLQRALISSVQHVMGMWCSVRFAERTSAYCSTA